MCEHREIIVQTIWQMNKFTHPKLQINSHMSQAQSPNPPFHTQQEEAKECLDQLTPMGNPLCMCVIVMPQQEASQSVVVLLFRHDGSDRCQICMSFYDTFVALDDTLSATLEEVTRRQNAFQLWHQHLNPKLNENLHATVHPMRKSLSPLPSCSQRAVDIHSPEKTHICFGESWLSASPDGILSTEELLEIKCHVLRSGHEFLEDNFSVKLFYVKMATSLHFYVWLGHQVLHRVEMIMQTAHLKNLTAVHENVECPPKKNESISRFSECQKTICSSDKALQQLYDLCTAGAKKEVVRCCHRATKSGRRSEWLHGTVKCRTLTREITGHFTFATDSVGVF